MEISQLEIFAQVGQLYAENTILKRQINELTIENHQIKQQLQPPTVPTRQWDGETINPVSDERIIEPVKKQYTKRPVADKAEAVIKA